MLKLLKDIWNPQGIDNELELLRYRSNLLGADLRITNFGGGNTSSKIEMVDPFTGQPATVLAVKGSGGDLGSIKTSGFALLYMDKLNAAQERVQRRAARRRDGRVLSAVRVRNEQRAGIDRHAASRVPAVQARRSPAPRLGDRYRRQRERQGEARRVQSAFQAQRDLAAVAAPWLRTRTDAAARRGSQSGLRRHHPRQSWSLHVGRYAGGVLSKQPEDDRRHGPVRAGARAEGAIVRRRQIRESRKRATRSPYPSCRTCAARSPRHGGRSVITTRRKM